MVNFESATALTGGFFMSNLIIIPTEETLKEKVNLKSPPQTKQPKYEAEKVEISDNIKRFDRKVKIYTSNPYTYNMVAKKNTQQPLSTTQTATQMITNPIYNSIGKFLGVDTIHDWGQYYDKVYLITEWAKQKVGEDKMKIMKWLTNKSRQVPSMGAKRIDDLHIAARLEMERK